MEHQKLDKMIEHENEFWDRIFKKELSQKISQQKDFSSFWWESYYKEITKFVLSRISRYSDPRILEAGSGSGKASILLGEVYRRTLLDISDSALEYAKHLAERFNAKNVGFLKGDIFRIPIADNSFDFVWNIGVVEHYDEDHVIDVITEMMRVCDKGAQVGIGVPNFKSLPIIKASVLRNKLLSFIPGYRLESENAYSEKQIKDFFKKGAKQANRTIGGIEVHYFGNPLFMETPKWLLVTLGKLLEHLAPRRKFLMFVICVVE